MLTAADGQFGRPVVPNSVFVSLLPCLFFLVLVQVLRDMYLYISRKLISLSRLSAPVSPRVLLPLCAKCNGQNPASTNSVLREEIHSQSWTSKRTQNVQAKGHVVLLQVWPYHCDVEKSGQAYQMPLFPR